MNIINRFLIFYTDMNTLTRQKRRDILRVRPWTGTEKMAYNIYVCVCPKQVLLVVCHTVRAVGRR
jgi:hypothetical protein